MSSSSGISSDERGSRGLMLLRLRQKLESALPEEPTESLKSQLSFYDLNHLPYVSQMRSLLLILCASTFVIAPIAYMPLGKIQAAYDQKCFLYTNLKIRNTGAYENKSARQEIIAVDPVTTEWGPTSFCDVTTFVPVSVSIFSIIIGMSTFTIWPTMMSLGRGGALMMAYAILALLGLGACATSTAFLYYGYFYTCKKLQEETTHFRQGGFSCQALNNVEILIHEVRLSRLAKNVHRSMVIAKIIHWCLLGLMFCKVLISLVTFAIIWYYINIS